MLISCSVVSCCQFQLFHAFLSTFANRRGRLDRWFQPPSLQQGLIGFSWIPFGSVTLHWISIEIQWFHWYFIGLANSQWAGASWMVRMAASFQLHKKHFAPRGPFSGIWVPFGSLFLFNVSLFTASYSMAWHHVTRFSASLHTPSIGVQRPWDLYIF